MPTSFATRKCEHQIVRPEWPYTGTRHCRNKATVKASDGKHYCGRHNPDKKA